MWHMWHSWQSRCMVSALVLHGFAVHAVIRKKSYDTDKHVDVFAVSHNVTSSWHMDLTYSSTIDTRHSEVPPERATQAASFHSSSRTPSLVSTSSSLPSTLARLVAGVAGVAGVIWRTSVEFMAFICTAISSAIMID